MVTIFKDVRDKDNPFFIPISKALARIVNGDSMETVNKVREGDRDKKKDLPVVLYSGKFSKRYDSDIVSHSGFIVLDFDKVDVEETKRALSGDSYVYACWASPSGNGVKALVRITNPERHRDHFRALCKYFERAYALDVDSSGINESRACFESYDPDLILNEGADKFGAFMSEQAESQKVVNASQGFTDYMKLNLAARMIRNADDGEKHAMLLRAAILCGGYTSSGRMEEDEVVRVLHREICKRDIQDEDQARKTILDGIERGKLLPVRDLMNEERSVQREMMINNGDMSFISSDDEDFKWINKYANGEIEVGLTTGDEKFDQYFRYKKELLIINGHSNVGKTTVALAMMVNASARHRWKWIIYSSENRTASIKMKLMQFAVNKEIGSMTYEQRKIAFKWVNEHFIVVSNKEVYSYSDIIIFIEKILRQQPVDGVFVDPYNSLRITMSNGSATSTHDYHYEAASEFLTLANAHDIAVWVNMHAVTEAQRRKGADGLPVAPFAEDTEGGGKFVNRADGFVTIHRKVQSSDHEERKTAEWHVRKVRETETGGEPTPMEEPIKLIMNVQRTGFRLSHNGSELFQGVDKEFDNYRSFNLPSNVDFLEKNK